MTAPLDAAARARLMKRMAAIPERLKATARREVEAEANAMADEMKRGAPRDEGGLEESIQAADESSDVGIRWRVTAGGPLTTRPVRKGAKATYDYANAAEYGTSDTPAQPFFWPTARRRRRKFKSRLMRQLKKAAQASGPGGA